MRAEERLPRQRPARGGADSEPVAPGIERRVAQRLVSAAAARPGAPKAAGCATAALRRLRCRPAGSVTLSLALLEDL